VEADGAFVSGGRDRLHPKAPEATAALGELVVEKAPYALPPKVGVNADEMYVPGLRRFEHDEAEEKPDEPAFVLDDERVVSKLPKKMGWANVLIGPPHQRSMTSTIWSKSALVILRVCMRP
jgi:hypothetical protein